MDGSPGLVGKPFGSGAAFLPANGIRNFNLDARPGEVISLRLANGEEMDFLLQSSDPEIIIANPEIGLQYHFRRDYRDQLIAPDDGG